MKIVSHVEAIVTVASQWEEMRPVAGVSPKVVMTGLAEKYRFQSARFSQIAQRVGAMLPRLETGEFLIGARTANINFLEFTPAKFSVSASHSKDALAFVDDILQFLEIYFDFRRPTSARSVLHRSTIISEFERDIASMFGRWIEIGQFIEQQANSGLTVDPFGVRFLASYSGEPPVAVTFERRVGAPEGANWLFSDAVLSSELHEAVLRKISNIFGD